MTKKANTILLFTEHHEAISFLTDEQAGQLFKAIYAYADDGSIPKFEGAIMSVFAMIRTQIDRSQEAYDRKCEKNRANSMKRKIMREKNVIQPEGNNPQPSITTDNDRCPSTTNVIFPNPNSSPRHNPNPSIDEGVLSPSINVVQECENDELSFEKVWALYDKPVGDVSALRQKWKELSADEKRKIIEYVPKYVQMRERRYRKDFINFLNCRTWETEPITNKIQNYGVHQYSNQTNEGKQLATFREANELVSRYIAECEADTATRSNETNEEIPHTEGIPTGQ